MSNNHKPELRRPPVYLYVTLGAVLLAFIQSFLLLSPILLSILLILLISLAVNPVISRVRALTGGRKVATALVAAAFVTFLALTGMAFIGPMKATIVKLGEQLPAYWERLQKPLIKMEKRAVLSEAKLQAEVSSEMAQTASRTASPMTLPRTVDPAPPPAANDLGSIRSSLSEMFQGVVGRFTAVAFNAAQIMVVLLTVFIGVTFTLMNPRPIFGVYFSLIPERHHDQALTIVQRIGAFMPKWAIATLLSMATIGMLVFLLMWPIFGFMDALVLGLIASVFEAVPLIGPILSAVPALLFALGEGGATPLWVLLIYVGVQVLENNVISTLIMARSMKLHPVGVMFSMLLCVATFGVLGVLIAPPMVAIVTILHDELYRKRFLPTVTDANLDRLARKALHERVT